MHEDHHDSIAEHEEPMEARAPYQIGHRQRPATAKGFFFITLEDETGMANLIVTPALFRQHRCYCVVRTSC
jgi:error-prone DNA polymerase